MSLGLLTAGCASSPAPPGPREASSPNTTAPSPPPARTAAETPGAQSAQPSYEWPDPDKDLWSRVRSGFELDANAGRPAVRKWTQYYATHRDHLDTSLDRARPFLWQIVTEVESRDMPAEIALLPIVESGYNPSAQSYVGASGLWQFMPATARHMGLAQDWWYDGRNDVTASTQAALDYLEMLCERYDGDWLLALAAYNAGPGRVDAALARADREDVALSYWNLELPLETTEYVPKLLAVRRIMMTPARFGVDWPTLNNVQRTETVRLPSQTEIAVAARMLDMPKPALRRLNPGMRRWASGPEDTHSLLVPAAKADRFRRQLADAAPHDLVTRRTHTVRRGDVLSRIAQRYGVSVSSLRQANHLRGDRITAGQTLQIPRPGAEPPAEPTQIYVVQTGDTFGAIAQRYNLDVASLQRANGTQSGALQPGQRIVIPGEATAPEPTTYVVQAGDSLWSIAHDNDVAVTDLKRWNRVGADTALQPGQTLAIDGAAPLPDFYEVENGDSLWSIANRFSMQVATLRSLNDMSSGSTIRPGQRLRLQPAMSG